MTVLNLLLGGCRRRLTWASTRRTRSQWKLTVFSWSLGPDMNRQRTTQTTHSAENSLARFDTHTSPVVTLTVRRGIRRLISSRTRTAFESKSNRSCNHRINVNVNIPIQQLDNYFKRVLAAFHFPTWGWGRLLSRCRRHALSDCCFIVIIIISIIIIIIIISRHQWSQDAL